MIPNVNLEEVKKYNSALKQYKDQSVQLNAEIEFLTNEITSLCAQLSQQLNTPVTPENIESVCENLASRINSSLQSGNAVLAKIASEQSKVVSNETKSYVANESVQVQQTAPVGLNMANVTPEVNTPINNQAVNSQVLPTFNPQAVEQTGFSSSVGSSTSIPTTLPPLFNSTL